MSVELRMPNITGSSEREQIAQIRSYLYQFIPQLQWALNTMGTTPSQSTVVVQTSSGYSSSNPVSTLSTFDSEVAFSELKPLIIKSADIVEAYYEEISARLKSIYVAESDFGTFVEATESEINKTSTKIEQFYTDMQQIISSIENLNFTLAEVNAHIRSGRLYNDESGIPVYGLEIGQKNIVDGEEVFNKYARFTSDRLSFYDQNDIEIAYISDYKIYITNAEITGKLKHGGYLIVPTNGLAYKWVGRS